MKNFISFIKSKTFLLQIGLAVVATVLIIVLTNWLLGVYTNSGRVIVVPQLVGHKQADVEEELHNADLELELIDSIYKPTVEPGAIVDQIPEAGKKVKKGRKIYVTINAFSKEMTVMPALVNFSQRNALVNLQNAGLELGNVDTVASPYHGLVLKQMVDGEPISAGAKLAKGTKVDLVVGRGDTGGVAYAPSVIGKCLEDAIEALGQARLSVGSIAYDGSVTSAPDTVRAVVFRQSPSVSAGALEAWTPVQLWLTIDDTKLSYSANDYNTDSNSDSESEGGSGDPFEF